MSIGHSPGIQQFLPDTRKLAKDISKEDLDEAQRRIEGSLAPAK